MSNPSKEKGNRAELAIRDMLREHTDLPWQRTPLSGALHIAHQMKSDLYIPNEHNLYSVECKHYADDHLNSTIFTSKNPQLFIWWDQVSKQSAETHKKPLLIFKHDRSKIFAAYEDIPETDLKHLYINIGKYTFFISLLEDWLKHEKPKFIR